MRFAGEDEEHRYLAANEFIQELKRAPEWMVSTSSNYNGFIILQTREKPIGAWRIYYSPDPLQMSAETWLEFVETVNLIAQTRRQEKTDG